MSSVMCLRLLGRQSVPRYVSRCLTRNCLQMNTRFFHINAMKRSTGVIGGAGGGSYEGDGKTTMTIVNKDLQGYLLIDTYSSQGFRLSNGMFAYGPIALFPSTVLQWDIKNADDIHEKSLSLFTIVEPRIEVLIIGVGDDTQQNRASTELNRRIRKILSEKKINCEVMPTKHAITTYNYLCVDHRVCAGAFLPPLYPDVDHEADLWLTSSSNRFLASNNKGVFG